LSPIPLFGEQIAHSVLGFLQQYLQIGNPVQEPSAAQEKASGIDSNSIGEEI
jgi:hypothetical protein